MPRIVEQESYGGAERRITRLGLATLWKELEEILTGFDLRVKEEKDANGGAAVRRILDQRLKQTGGWQFKQVGEVDWTKCIKTGRAHVCVGVEIQFSARSDLMIVDIDHLRLAITAGEIDIGVLTVPSNRLGPFLTDRVGRFDDGRRAVQRARASDLPILVLGLEHDGPGPPLPKQKTRQGKPPTLQ